MENSEEGLRSLWSDKLEETLAAVQGTATRSSEISINVG